MLKRTISSHILILVVTSQITRTFHSSLLKDFHFQVLMTSSCSCLTKSLHHKIIKVQLLLQEMLQELSWETKRPSTSSRIFHQLVDQHQFWSISMHYSKQLDWMLLNQLSLQDRLSNKTRSISLKDGSRRTNLPWLMSLVILLDKLTHKWLLTSSNNQDHQTRLSKDWLRLINLIRLCHIVNRLDMFQTLSRS